MKSDDVVASENETRFQFLNMLFLISRKTKLGHHSLQSTFQSREIARVFSVCNLAAR